MSLLHQLAPEVLRQIVDDLSADWLINLWLTGSRPLRNALSSRGGVSSVILEMARRRLMSYPIPGIIFGLKGLLSLTIDAPCRAMDRPSEVWDYFSQLTQLRKLSLSCDYAFDWLFTEDEDFALSARPFAETFPFLQSLRLEFSYQEDFPATLPRLPSSLTRLELPKFEVTPESLNIISELPNLYELHVLMFRDTEHCMLPKSVTSLTTTSVVRTEPLHFTSSFWNGASLLKYSGTITYSALQQIPTTLESLSLFQQSLTNPPNIRLPDLVSLTHLPNLKHLHVQAPHFPEPEPTFIFASPSKLETIPRLVMASFSTGQILGVPSTLKHLEFAVDDWENFDVEPLLKAVGDELKGLETFDFSLKSERSESKNMKSIDNLPHTLKTLLWASHASIDDHFPSFPPNLTILKGPLLDTQFAILPRTLTELNALLELTPKTLDKLASKSGLFPPQLSILTVEMANRATKAPVFAKLIDVFPLRQLTELTILKSTAAYWTVKMIKKLSPLTQRLHLDLRSLEPGSVASLPRGLVHLTLNCAQKSGAFGFVSTEELKSLPRTLRTLELTGAYYNFRDKDLADLPSQLREFNVPQTPLLTEKSLSVLPWIIPATEQSRAWPLWSHVTTN